MSGHFNFPLSEFEDLLETLQVSFEEAQTAISSDPDLQSCIQAANGDVTKIRTCLQERLPKATRRFNEFLQTKHSNRKSE